MEKVRELRTRASECRELAAKAATDTVRDQYSRAAEMWDKLADEQLKIFVEFPPGETEDASTSETPHV